MANQGQKYLSVIVPVYNAAATLEACLKSIENIDNFADCELIVADDGSVDASLAIANKYADKIEISPKNKGASFVRNLGAKAASGEILFFVDSDVVIESRQVIEYLKKDFSRDDICGVNGVYAENLPFADFFSLYKHLSTRFGQQAVARFSSIASSATMAVPRTVFLEAGGFNEDFPGVMAEDIEFSLRLAVRTGKFWQLDERISGRHFKRYTLRSLLKTDYLRVKGIAKATAKTEFRAGYLKSCAASSSAPLLLAFFSAMLFLGSFFYFNFFWLALAFFLLFFLIQAKYFNYLKQRQGLIFAILALSFSFGEMLLAGSFAFWWQLAYKFKKS